MDIVNNKSHEPLGSRDGEQKTTPNLARKTRYKIKRQLDTPLINNKKPRGEVSDSSVALKEIINLNSYVTPQAEK